MNKETRINNDPRRRMLSALTAAVLLAMASISGADTMKKGGTQKMDASMESGMSDAQTMEKDDMMQQQMMGTEEQGMMDKGKDGMMQEGMGETQEKGQEMMEQEMKK